MIELKRYPDSPVLEFTLDGALTRVDFDRVTAAAEEMIEEYGQIRFIEVIRSFGKIEASALWADFKWGPKHLKCFSHVAVVSDKKWIEWMIKPFRPFLSAEIRSFDLDELEDARAWAHAAVKA